MRDGGLESPIGGHLDPLLRELLDFGVVERAPTDGAWRLCPQAHAALDRLAAPRPPADKIIYFGHRCASCRQVRPTRLRAAGLLCDDCDAPAAPIVWAAPVPGPPPAPTDDQPPSQLTA